MRRGLQVFAAQILPHQLDRYFEHQVRQRGEVVGELLHRQQPGQVLGEEAEHLRLVRLAQQVHAPLGVVVRRGKLAFQCA